ncbi:MAG: hypothetical protein ABJ360_22405 [Roseobacter sp.]
MTKIETLDVPTSVTPVVFPHAENTKAGFMRKIGVVCDVLHSARGIWSYGIPYCIKNRTIEGAVSYYQNTRCIPLERIEAVHEFIAAMLPIPMDSTDVEDELRDLFAPIIAEAQRQEEMFRREFKSAPGH